MTKNCESSGRQKFAGETRKKKPKFQVGDKVRVSRVKQVFEKGYTPNWSTEIFNVTKVASTNIFTYNLKDYGGFYVEELRKVYLVEKIVKERGIKVDVKWLGLDIFHIGWIDKLNL